MLCIAVLWRHFSVASFKRHEIFLTKFMWVQVWRRSQIRLRKTLYFFHIPSLVLCLKVSSKQAWRFYVKVYAGKNWFYYMIRVILCRFLKYKTSNPLQIYQIFCNNKPYDFSVMKFGLNKDILDIFLTLYLVHNWLMAL